MRVITLELLRVYVRSNFQPHVLMFGFFFKAKYAIDSGSELAVIDYTFAKVIIVCSAI